MAVRIASFRPSFSLGGGLDWATAAVEIPIAAPAAIKVLIVVFNAFSFQVFALLGFGV